MIQDQISEDLYLDAAAAWRETPMTMGADGKTRVLLRDAIEAVIRAVLDHRGPKVEPVVPSELSPRLRRIQAFIDLSGCDRGDARWCRWKDDIPCQCRIAADEEAWSMT